MNWSTWFEEALTEYSDEFPENQAEWAIFVALKPDVLGVMGWIVSVADSSGAGFGLDAHSDMAIAREIGATEARVRRSFEALAAVGFIELVEDHPAGIAALRATLSRGGGPEDAEICERLVLIASFPWRKE